MRRLLVTVMITVVMVLGNHNTASASDPVWCKPSGPGIECGMDDGRIVYCNLNGCNDIDFDASLARIQG